MKARIIRSTGSWYFAQNENKEIFTCRLRGIFKNEGMKLTNPIAVGDWVNIETEDEQNNNFLIDEILPRDNYLIRKSSRNAHNNHIIASNLDQAILFATIREPKTSLGFIDRFLVSAEAYRIPAIIIFNKSDLYKAKDFEKFEHLKSYYDTLSYTSYLCSVAKNEGIETIKELLKGKTSLIAGHSGVGKSSVINAINPNLDLKTGEISKFSSKGTHTTTFAEMFEIFDESYIIDTPGIKEMGIANMEKSELKDQFPEMRKYLNQCKFDDCLHLEEPNCKVRQAIDNEEIAEWRYLSYLSMLAEL
jgi:ribosome biogenesis GTPase